MSTDVPNTDGGIVDDYVESKPSDASEFSEVKFSFGTHREVEIVPEDSGYKANLSSTGDEFDSYTRRFFSAIFLNGSLIRPIEPITLQDVFIGITSTETGKYALSIVQ